MVTSKRNFVNLRYLNLETMFLVLGPNRRGSSPRYIPPKKEGCNVGRQHFIAIFVYRGSNFLVAAQHLHQHHRMPSRGIDSGSIQDRRFPDAVLAREECHAPEPGDGKVIDPPKSTDGQIR